MLFYKGSENRPLDLGGVVGARWEDLGTHSPRELFEPAERMRSLRDKVQK